MKAPRPCFTSSTMAGAPPASFLLMTLLAISGMLPTVPVTSRRAYSLPSAGARSGDWPAMAAPTVRDLPEEPLRVDLNRQPGERLQLVERAAGEAEAPPRELGHADAERGNQWHDDQGELVADAAGAVFVHDRPPDPAQVQLTAGAGHQLGQIGKLLPVHPLTADGHQPCRDLIVGNVAAHVPADELPPARRATGDRPSVCGPAAPESSRPRRSPRVLGSGFRVLGVWSPLRLAPKEARGPRSGLSALP